MAQSYEKKHTKPEDGETTDTDEELACDKSSKKKPKSTDNKLKEISEYQTYISCGGCGRNGKVRKMTMSVCMCLFKRLNLTQEQQTQFVRHADMTGLILTCACIKCLDLTDPEIVYPLDPENVPRDLVRYLLALSKKRHTEKSCSVCFRDHEYSHICSLCGKELETKPGLAGHTLRCHKPEFAETKNTVTNARKKRKQPESKTETDSEPEPILAPVPAKSLPDFGELMGLSELVFSMGKTRPPTHKNKQQALCRPFNTF